jgi:molybdate transport system substrate-binding protein
MRRAESNRGAEVIKSGGQNMKHAMRATAFAVFVAMAAMILGFGYARAQADKGEVTLIAPGGARAALEQLFPGFEKKTGYKVKATFGSGGGTHKQVVNGDVFDVPVVQPPYQDVIDSGNVVKSSEKPLASVAVGIAVKQGAPKPDISSPAAVKKMFASAKSISYPDPKRGAAAGVTVDEMFKKLGIAAEVEPKLKRASGGAGAMKMVAEGEAEIGMTFLSEMEEPGITVVGALPKSVATPTRLVGFVSAHAKNPAAAKALLAYLSSPEAAAGYKSQRMTPGK